MGTPKSAHVDTFCADNLPPQEAWPELIFDLPELRYPAQLNCATSLLEDAIAEGFGEKTAIIDASGRYTYVQINALANQYAHVLTRECGLVPGNRVLLRGGNSARLAAAWFAVMKAGLVAVTTMPLLRAKELAQVASKGSIHLGLCDAMLMEEAEGIAEKLGRPFETLSFGTGGALDLLASRQPDDFDTVHTAQNDVCLLAFTSGTTGEPKACMHFHRDVMAMCDTFSRHILQPARDDIFIGTPPLAFTFGLGALLAFPFHARATTVFPLASTPGDLADAIKAEHATIVLTSPTAYRALLSSCSKEDLSSMREAVSAGEHLPKKTFEDWESATGIKMINGIGATEMIHIFIASRGEDIRPGSTGKPVPGFSAALLNDDGEIIVGAGEGRLAIKGPIGCRYLNDDRQAKYVEGGWNVTGDRFARDEDGYYWYQARSDSMIVSSGYNIAAPEVEQALLTHPQIAQCAVIGAPDEARGQVVKAFVVPKKEPVDEAALVRHIQNHVKASIAPYKYPRQITFLKDLPKTPTGKVSLSALKAL
ncbi:MAG: AMP-binding protein [Pseudomonadota bacterium]